jgi:hypothetical protein
MNSLIIRLVIVLALFPTSASALTRIQLRSRLNNVYLRDASNLMLAAATKDSILNSAQAEYAGMFPVKVDTAHILLDSAERIETLPSNYAGIVLSIHKFNREFTELKYIPGDSVPVADQDVPTYYTLREKMIVVYPPPVSEDSVFVFYAAQPTAMSADSTECRLQDWLEEPLLLLAASKCWEAADLRSDQATRFYGMFIEQAERLTRTKVEKPKP